MNTETQAYYADRLVRSVARADLMSEAQRKDLAWAIKATPGCPKLLASCADKLDDGTLTQDEALAAYRELKQKDFDPDSYRASMAPAPDVTRDVDKRLADLLK